MAGETDDSRRIHDFLSESGADGEEPVIERQLDEVHNERLLVEDERATCFVLSNTHQSCPPTRIRT